MNEEEQICARMAHRTAALVLLALTRPSDTPELEEASRKDSKSPIYLTQENQQNSIQEFNKTFDRQADRTQELIALIEAARLTGDYVSQTLEDLRSLDKSLRQIESVRDSIGVNELVKQAVTIANRIRDRAHESLTELSE